MFTDKLNVKIYADGADLQSMLNEYEKGIVKGFTTNPSLMKSAGVKNYKEFSKSVLNYIKDMSVSFEVFADDEEKMLEEAREIASWGDNVYIKIPVLDTKGNFTGSVIKKLADENIKLNITAVFTMEQVNKILSCLNKDIPAIISIFAGRIADTGVDPIKIVKAAVDSISNYTKFEILWASSREIYNIFQANEVGCHIITVQNSLLNKCNLVGKDLNEYSIDTVNDFYKDAKSLGFTIL